MLLFENHLELSLGARKKGQAKKRANSSFLGKKVKRKKGQAEKGQAERRSIGKKVKRKKGQ